MLYFKTLIYIDVLIAAALLLFRWTLPLSNRPLISGKLAAIALTTPAVALLSGDVYLFCLYLAVMVTVNARSQLELAGIILTLLPWRCL